MAEWAQSEGGRGRPLDRGNAREDSERRNKTRMVKSWVVAATRPSITQRLDDALDAGSVPALRQALLYDCDPALLGPYGRLFFKLSANERTLEFLRSHPPHSVPAAWLRTVAGTGQ